MPVVHPADLWKETGRWYGIGSEMGRFLDKADRDMVLAMTHEEVVTDLVAQGDPLLPPAAAADLSHPDQVARRPAPARRADPRPRVHHARQLQPGRRPRRAGRAVPRPLPGYFNIFDRCALPVIASASDVGMMGGSMAHEYMYLTPIGEDTLLLCDNCGYAANRQIARFRKPPAAPKSAAAAGKGRHARTSTTIDALAEFLDMPKAQDRQSRVHGRHDHRGRRETEQVRLRRGARRYGRERDQAGERREGQGAAPGARGRDPGRRRRAGLWLADRRA